MRKCMRGQNGNIEYSVEMTTEQYRAELQKIFSEIEDNRVLRYFYVYTVEKIKRVL